MVMTLKAPTQLGSKTFLGGSVLGKTNGSVSGTVMKFSFGTKQIKKEANRATQNPKDKVKTDVKRATNAVKSKVPAKNPIGTLFNSGNGAGNVQRKASQATSKVKQAVKRPVNTAPVKKAPQQVRRAAAPVRKAVQKAVPRGTINLTGEALWLPFTTREATPWLDGSLPGDRGFDPLGLAKKQEYLQFDLDELDQNKAVNKAGQLSGVYLEPSEKLSANSLQPYASVFDILRFRENELIHGRWAMLATLGVIVQEATTKVNWADAGLYELRNGTEYLGFKLPFSISQVSWIEFLLMAGVEVFRNTELDLEKRLYPGGVFDPLGLASANDERTFRLKEAELKHGRLAMIAFLGFSVQAATTGEGALSSLARFANTFGAAETAIENAVEAVENLAS